MPRISPVPARAARLTALNSPRHPTLETL